MSFFMTFLHMYTIVACLYGDIPHTHRSSFSFQRPIEPETLLFPLQVAPSMV